MKNKIIGFFGIISNGLKIFSLNIKILVQKMKTSKNQNTELATGLSTADENTEFLMLVKLLEESKAKLAESLKLFF